jgi:folate-binding protein YgfZ
MLDLHDLQVQAGAIFTELEGLSVPTSFGNDLTALAAARQAVILCDRTHWGRLQITGADRIRYLHNQSTNDFYRLQPGQGCDTVFVTSTARTIDLVTAYVRTDNVLLLVAPNRRKTLLKWLDRYIFPADQVFIQDLTETTVTWSLIGPDSTALLEKLEAGCVPQHPDGNHQEWTIAGVTTLVAIGSGLAMPGYTLIVNRAIAAPLWEALTIAGAMPAGEEVWQQLRIEQGRPIPDAELTEDYNPLEAGLWQTISFEKGCYIGQETIARLNTYQGVKQQLWGVHLSSPAEVGSAVMLDDEKIGKLTSISQTPSGWIGLAYIRTKAGGEGLRVQIGEARGDIIEVPFLRRSAQG